MKQKPSKNIEPIHEEEAARLKKLFKDRAGMSQEAFGAKYNIGTQGMVWQFLNAKTPDKGSALHLEAAISFASGLQCNVSDFSPRLAALLPSSYLQQSSDGEQFPNSQKGDENMPKLASVSRLKPHADVATIHEYETGGAMGHGLALRDQPGVIHGWQVNREWLEKNTGHHTGIGNLCIVTGFGDSMKPMFNPGDPVLIDRGVTTMDFDGIYFFRIGDEGFIKRLQKIPTSNGFIYRAKSENPKYDTWEITQDMDFEVLGRVVKAWKGEEC